MILIPREGEHCAKHASPPKSSPKAGKHAQHERAAAFESNRDTKKANERGDQQEADGCAAQDSPASVRFFWQVTTLHDDGDVGVSVVSLLDDWCAPPDPTLILRRSSPPMSPNRCIHHGLLISAVPLPLGSPACGRAPWPMLISTTVSSNASRPWRADGSGAWSPGYSSRLSPLPVRRTTPTSTCNVAAPGLSWSARDCRPPTPAASASAPLRRRESTCDRRSPPVNPSDFQQHRHGTWKVDGLLRFGGGRPPRSVASCRLPSLG